MNFDELYHFFFETMPGVASLIGIGIVISIILCVILERRTRKLYRDRPAQEDEWTLFEDDQEEE